jgi:hypothetical protein
VDLQALDHQYAGSANLAELRDIADNLAPYLRCFDRALRPGRSTAESPDAIAAGLLPAKAGSLRSR